MIEENGDRKLARGRAAFGIDKLKAISAISEAERNNAALLFEELEPFFKRIITEALARSFPSSHGNTTELQAAYWVDVAMFFQRRGEILDCCGPEMSRIAEQHKQLSAQFRLLAVETLTGEEAP